MYLKSSEKENIQAAYYGHGTIKDEKKAFELYLKYAKVGYRLASIMMEVAFRKIEVKLLNCN